MAMLTSRMLSSGDNRTTMAPFLTDASVTLFLAIVIDGRRPARRGPRCPVGRRQVQGSCEHRNGGGGLGPARPTTSALLFVPYDDGIAPERGRSRDEG